MIPTGSNGSDSLSFPGHRVRPAADEASHVSQATRFELLLPSDLRMIEAAVGYLVDRCRRHAFAGPRLTLNFRVGVTEALANAVLYGNGADPGKYVRVEVHIDGVRVACLVEDQGRGYDPRSIPDPTLPENLHGTGGRGLFLIRKLMDDVEFSDSGNAIRLVLLRDPPRTRRTAGG